MIIRLQGFADSRDVFLNEKKLDPRPSQKMRNHSPDGFMWGYHGSGPAQLALAVLLACLPKDIAAKNYQDFKGNVIATFDKDKDFDEMIALDRYSK